MKHTILVFFLFCGFISCSKVDDNVYKNEFQTFIHSKQEILTEKYSFVQNNEYDSIGFHKLIVDRNNQVIVVDDVNWNIHLFNSKGEIVNSVGGSGRGPGEFMVINDLSLSSDDTLYILDKRLHRVSKYSVFTGGMRFIDSYSLPSYGSLTIESLDVTESQGYVGVFRELHRTDSSNTPFIVKRLSKNFEIEDKLFSISGNDSVTLRGIAAVDSPFGFRTFWQISDDNFYYARSDDLSFTTINLETLEKKITRFYDGQLKNSMTDELKDFLSGHFQMMIRAYPEVAEKLQKQEILPYFRNLFVDVNYVFLDIFPDNHDLAYVLGFDRKTKELFLIKVPQWFTVSGINSSRIFGIVGSGFIDEDNDILVIEF